MTEILVCALIGDGKYRLSLWDYDQKIRIMYNDIAIDLDWDEITAAVNELKKFPRSGNDMPMTRTQYEQMTGDRNDR